MTAVKSYSTIRIRGLLTLWRILRTSTCSQLFWVSTSDISELWANEAKAEIVVAVVGSRVVAIRDATVPRVVVPTTATVHAV